MGPAGRLGGAGRLTGAQLRRAAYDTEAAAARIRATGLPDAQEFADGVLRPASAEEATREFEARAAGRK